jgi:hypothetical protein
MKKVLAVASIVVLVALTDRERARSGEWCSDTGLKGTWEARRAGESVAKQ